MTVAAWLWQRFRPIAALAAAAGIAYALWAQREAAAAVPWELVWPLFLAAVGAFACGPPLCATGYWLLLRDVAARPPYLPSIRTWTRSFLARYVPSGALTVAVRLRERGGASASQVLSATAFEQLAATLAGAAVATAAFALARAEPPVGALVALVGAAAAVAALRSGRVRRRLPWLDLVRARALAGATALSLTSWVAAGAAVWILCAAIAPGAGEPLLLVGAYAFAWLLGFLVVLAPGGLGVREATLVLLAAPQLGLGAATLLAVLLRLANILGDLLGAALVELGAAAAGPRPRQALRNV